MAKLTLSGVSDDGGSLVLSDEVGAEHTLPIEDDLRAAVSQSAPHTTENQMDSALRPRDIQARIRAGESPEAVAQAAGAPVERVMIYAAPVLAEREHIAGRAQRSSVRRSTGDSPHRTLGDAVAATLRRVNVSAERVTWDAWRRQDGRWTLSGGYAVTDRTGNATFAFDAPGNFVVAENDDARWLIGDLAPPATDAEAPQQEAVGGLSVVRDEPQLGDDALDLAASAAHDTEESSHPTSDSTAEIPAVQERAEPVSHQTSIEDFFEQEGPYVDGASPEEPDPIAEPVVEEPAPRKRRKGRASVPSWDEIMFGGGDQKQD